tara:strand:- start:627 stop:1040 length:414 start_codon:yes stop_codon:yes gene_type:complete
MNFLKRIFEQVNNPDELTSKEEKIAKILFKKIDDTEYNVSKDSNDLTQVILRMSFDRTSKKMVDTSKMNDVDNLLNTNQEKLQKLQNESKIHNNLKTKTLLFVRNLFRIGLDLKQEDVNIALLKLIKETVHEIESNL